MESLGPNVTEFRPDVYVFFTVGRQGSSLYDEIGTYDMTTDDVYFERDIMCAMGSLLGRMEGHLEVRASSSTALSSSASTSVFLV